MSKKEYYYFIDRVIETKEIRDLKRYKLDIPQSELMGKIEKYNRPESGPMEHVQVHQALMKEVIDLALQWKSNRSIDDIAEQLSYIENDIYNARTEISDYIEYRQKKKRHN